MTARKKSRVHVFGTHICEVHQTILEDLCWCQHIHGGIAVPHGDDCPVTEATA